jgi:hypothetical protein
VSHPWPRPLNSGGNLSDAGDAAFDQGLVSFAEDGAVLAGRQLSEARARPGCRCIAAASRPQRRALSKSQDASRAPSIFGRGDFEAAPSYCREDLLSAVIHREAEIRDSAPGMVNVNQRGAGWPTVASRPHRRDACPAPPSRGAAVCPCWTKRHRFAAEVRAPDPADANNGPMKNSCICCSISKRSGDRLG